MIVFFAREKSDTIGLDDVARPLQKFLRERIKIIHRRRERINDGTVALRERFTQLDFVFAIVVIIAEVLGL